MSVRRGGRQGEMGVRRGGNEVVSGGRATGSTVTVHDFPLYISASMVTPPPSQPMMRPAPIWKLFFGWLSTPARVRVRGRGSSRFSRTPFTVQVESREPRNRRPARGISTYRRHRQ